MDSFKGCSSNGVVNLVVVVDRIFAECSVRHKLNLLHTIKKRNQQSELYLAQQEKDQRNYADNFGTFGFLTTKSEREVFMHREDGLMQAIRRAFEKVTES